MTAENRLIYKALENEMPDWSKYSDPSPKQNAELTLLMVALVSGTSTLLSMLANGATSEEMAGVSGAVAKTVELVNAWWKVLEK